MRIITLILILFLGFGSSAFAETTKRYASIVVDADSLEIIHARQIDGQRFPASLTKIMTLYLTFDALNAGVISLKDPLTVSRHAAATPPYGLGLRAGEKITVEQAIQALTVRSANDAAVVLAERIAGSEQAFAAQMTLKARALKMQRTTFMTPHGLPHPAQTTTARDMAKLGLALLTQHQRYYHYFGQTHFTWKGRTHRNTNSLLHWLSGVDGMKTGFTNASGYNLAISAQRDGRRIVAVVLGGASGHSRDRHMQDLIERSFKTLGVRPVSSRAPITVKRDPITSQQPVRLASVTQAVRLRGRDNAPITVTNTGKNIKIAAKSYDLSWSIQVGAFSKKQKAQDQLQAVGDVDVLANGKPKVIPLRRGELTLYRARVDELSALQAQSACQALKHLSSGCLVIAPGGG